MRILVNENTENITEMLIGFIDKIPISNNAVAGIRAESLKHYLFKTDSG